MNTNIGILAQKTFSGHSYVNKTFARALRDDFNVHIYAFSGGSKDSLDFWSSYPTKTSDTNYFRMKEDLDEIKKWIDDNDIEIMLFNEVYDWDVVEELNQTVKTICYVVPDAVIKGTVEKYDKYDKLIVASPHIKERFPDAELINWGVDLEKLKPQDNDMMFQHNAGWGGVGYRKCTPAIIKAYNRLREKGYDFGMRINAQANLFDKRSGVVIERWDKLEVKVGTHPYEEQYSFGKVYVGPSEYEGLGLYLPEALACGLPIITTNAEPMNQFVEDGKTGKLIEPLSAGPHPKRRIVFPRYKVRSLEIRKGMEWFLENEDKIKKMSKNARKAAQKYSFKQFKKSVVNICNSLIQQTNKA